MLRFLIVKFRFHRITWTNCTAKDASARLVENSRDSRNMRSCSHESCWSRILISMIPLRYPHCSQAWTHAVLLFYLFFYKKNALHHLSLQVFFCLWIFTWSGYTFICYHVRYQCNIYRLGHICSRILNIMLQFRYEKWYNLFNTGTQQCSSQSKNIFMLFIRGEINKRVFVRPGHRRKRLRLYWYFSH